MAAAPRSPASLGSTPKRHPPVSKLLRAMRSPDAAKRADALDIFADIVGEAYGEAGAELGMAVRDGDGIAVLASLLGDPYPQVQQQALFVIGNLCSDSVDAHSRPSCTHTRPMGSSGSSAERSEPAIVLSVFESRFAAFLDPSKSNMER